MCVSWLTNSSFFICSNNITHPSKKKKGIKALEYYT